ncbi:hypothetical protein BMETH_26272653602423, partial [methanotrophic bacterial endosymbiont of Bathymodiolus sp.]
ALPSLRLQSWLRKQIKPFATSSRKSLPRAPN